MKIRPMPKYVGQLDGFVALVRHGDREICIEKEDIWNDGRARVTDLLLVLRQESPAVDELRKLCGRDIGYTQQMSSAIVAGGGTLRLEHSHLEWGIKSGGYAILEKGDREGAFNHAVVFSTTTITEWMLRG